MTDSLFVSFPDSARLWIYPAGRNLTADEQAPLLAHLEGFMSGWQSHGRVVRGEAAVLHDRFLVVAAYLPATGDLSGCGIDASVHEIDAIGSRMGFSWLSALHVFYRDASHAVQAVTRPVFRSLVTSGEISGQTPVFDPSIDTLGALRAGAFEKPALFSWHARVFSIPETEQTGSLGPA